MDAIFKPVLKDPPDSLQDLPNAPLPAFIQNLDDNQPGLGCHPPIEASIGAPVPGQDSCHMGAMAAVVI